MELKNKVVTYDKNGNPIGTITINQFQLLTQGADNHKEILLAEKEKRLLVYLTKERIPFNNEEAKFKIILIWKTKEKTDKKTGKKIPSREIKKLVLYEKLSLEPLDQNFFDHFYGYYKDFAIFGFPVAIFVIILLI